MPSKKRNAAKARGPKLSQAYINRRGNDSPFAWSHTLAEEARNTANKRRGWGNGEDARLRYQPVAFISAGFMDPLKDAKLPHRPLPSSVLHKKTAQPVIAPEYVEGKTHRPAPSPPQLEPDDGDDSSSSAEVILFKGRKNAACHPKPTPAPTRGRQVAAVPETTDDGVRSLSRTIARLSVERSIGPDFIPLGPSARLTPPLPSPESEPRSPLGDEAAIIADYIANIDDGSDDDPNGVGLTSHSFNILRELGGADSEADPGPPSSEDGLGDGIADEDGEEEDDEDDRDEVDLEAEDERLPRILTTQEELGLGGDDVVLLDSASSGEGWLPASAHRSKKKKGNSKKDSMFQRGSQFPSATRMADAFDELDLMDLKQPRMRASKRGHVSFNVSDSELEAALNVALKKDRLKKAEKKKAREELRSQGLLGKNVNPDDLRVKYRGGMSLDDLANELEEFMLSTREQMILPPFDKPARQIVHKIANTFKIKSQSAGKGLGRYNVLYRTKTTLSFDPDRLEIALSRVHRNWFPRVDADEKLVSEARILKRAEATSSKRRGGKSSLVLREGDIVGQHAAELSTDNKGRTMLEKMGWSKGMSLGTDETKGITVPLMHVVKKTKAGLGDS